MRWIKPNNSPKKDATESKKGGKSGRNKSKSTSLESADNNRTRTVIVFNPILWKEEIVNLIED
jgi:hypothetical protein